MESGYGSGRLWRLLSPVLFFWIISFVAQLTATLFFLGRRWMGILREYQPFTLERAQNEIIPMYMDQMTEQVAIYLPQVIVFSSLMTLVYGVLTFRKDRSEEKEAGFSLEKMPKIWQYGLIVGLVMVASLGLNFILIMLQAAFPNLTYSQMAQSAIFAAPFWFQILGFGLIAPVAEEFIFRGLIFKRYRETNSFVKSMILSSLIFGIVHSNTIQFIYATILGLLFAYTYEKFGTLLAPILLHVVANVFPIIMTNLNGFAWFFEDSFRLGATIVLCGFLSSVLLVLLQNSQIDVKKIEDEVQQSGLQQDESQQEEV